jgi:predicted AAA+ superfamily ATPase
MELRRTIEPFVREDLSRKMVFVAGPRQGGKTTLAKRVLAEAIAAATRWTFS